MKHMSFLDSKRDGSKNGDSHLDSNRGLPHTNQLSTYDTVSGVASRIATSCPYETPFYDVIGRAFSALHSLNFVGLEKVRVNTLK